MSVRSITCWPWKLATLSIATASILFYLYYEIGCTWRAQVQLDDHVSVRIKNYTDKPGGVYTTRSVEISIDGRRGGRIWCPPSPARTGVATGLELSLCKGQAAEYLVARDNTAFWIVDLKEPSNVLTEFPEKSPPSVEVSYGINDVGRVTNEHTSYERWVEHLSRRRDLLRR
jgi:hypothetical protein